MLTLCWYNMPTYYAIIMPAYLIQAYQQHLELVMQLTIQTITTIDCTLILLWLSQHYYIIWLVCAK